MRGKPGVSCPIKAVARRLPSASRGSACASSGVCSRPAARGKTSECVAKRSCGCGARDDCSWRDARDVQAVRRCLARRRPELVRACGRLHTAPGSGSERASAASVTLLLHRGERRERGLRRRAVFRSAGRMRPSRRAPREPSCSSEARAIWPSICSNETSASRTRRGCGSDCCSVVALREPCRRARHRTRCSSLPAATVGVGEGRVTAAIGGMQCRPLGDREPIAMKRSVAKCASSDERGPARG